MFVILADLGLQALMTREISRLRDGITEIASTFFTLRLLSSAVFLLFGVAASLLFPYSGAVKFGMVIAVSGMFFLSVSQLLLGIFQKHLAMHITAIAEIAGRGLQLLLVYIIFRGNVQYPILTLYLFLGAMSVASLFIFVLQYFFARKYIKIGWRADFAQWKAILKVSWPIALSIVFTLIYFKIDTIFLSLMKPPGDVGIYGVAYRVLESLIFFPAMFAGIMLPILSKDAAEADLSNFRETFAKALRVITIFAIPVTVGGVILSYSIANLIGGKEFEMRDEANPMIGSRGAARYLHPCYSEAFRLECLAVKKAREEFGFKNIIPMIPFCRTPAEGLKVIALMKECGLERGRDGLQVYMMVEIPSNIFLADRFADIFDGFSIGSNDLTQLIYGVDRDSGELAGLVDENDEGIRRAIKGVIGVVHSRGKKIGICGEAPSYLMDFTRFLVECGIDSITITSGSLDQYKKTAEAIKKFEEELGIK